MSPPLVIAAAAVTTLNVEPGGNVSDSARLANGRFGSVLSRLYASCAALVLWVDSRFGSKLGMDAEASSAPVVGSSATTAPRGTRLRLLTSSAYAFSCVLLDSVSSTLPPAGFLPVNIPAMRSAACLSDSPMRKSLSSFSMSVAARLTGLKPTMCAYCSLNG